MHTYTNTLFFALALLGAAHMANAGETSIENSFDFNVNTGGNSGAHVSEGTASVTIDMTTVIDGEVVEDVHETYTGTSVSERYESHTKSESGGESTLRYSVETGTQPEHDVEQAVVEDDVADSATEPIFTSDEAPRATSSGLSGNTSTWLAQVRELQETISIVLAYVYSFF